MMQSDAFYSREELQSIIRNKFGSHPAYQKFYDIYYVHKDNYRLTDVEPCAIFFKPDVLYYTYPDISDLRYTSGGLKTKKLIDDIYSSKLVISDITLGKVNYVTMYVVDIYGRVFEQSDRKLTYVLHAKSYQRSKLNKFMVDLLQQSHSDIFQLLDSYYNYYQLQIELTNIIRQKEILEQTIKPALIPMRTDEEQLIVRKSNRVHRFMSQLMG